MLLGHRGAPRLAHENTHEALNGALDAGLHGFETDLQRTKDGVLVIHHDHHLEGGEEISSLTHAELKELAPHVIDLVELRDLMSERPEAIVNLEVKTDAPYMDGRAEELAAALKAWPSGLLERLWISSFDPLLLLRLHASEVPVPLGFLVVHASALALLPSLPVVAVHPHFTLLSEESVRGWHAAGLGVFTWTVNDAPLAARSLGVGVDGLIGDEPEVLLGAASGA